MDKFISLNFRNGIQLLNLICTFSCLHRKWLLCDLGVTVPIIVNGCRKCFSRPNADVSFRLGWIPLQALVLTRSSLKLWYWCYAATIWMPKFRHLNLEINSTLKHVAENLLATGRMIYLTCFQYLQQFAKARLCLLTYISQITSNMSSALSMHLKFTWVPFSTGTSTCGSSFLNHELTVSISRKCPSAFQILTQAQH